MAKVHAARIAGRDAQIASLTAENERLRALVEKAYEEGWDDKGYPNYFDNSWDTSNTRAALQPKENTQ